MADAKIATTSLKPCMWKPCPCKHGFGMQKNVIGEVVVFCELTAQWMNVNLGECLGNCESEEREDDNNGKSNV